MGGLCGVGTKEVFESCDMRDEHECYMYTTVLHIFFWRRGSLFIGNVQ